MAKAIKNWKSYAELFDNSKVEDGKSEFSLTSAELDVCKAFRIPPEIFIKRRNEAAAGIIEVKNGDIIREEYTIPLSDLVGETPMSEGRAIGRDGWSEPDAVFYTIDPGLRPSDIRTMEKRRAIELKWVGAWAERSRARRGENGVSDEERYNSGEKPKPARSEPRAADLGGSRKIKL